jgi:N-methylhydantoinase A
MSWRLGVDTGGTFTDVCLFDEQTSRFAITKVSSTPHDPGEAVVEGVRDIIVREGHRLAGVPDPTSVDDGMTRIGYFAHGTTVATNALLQGRGAKTGVITTTGFRDLLEIARQRRPKLYDLSARKAELFSPRYLRREVRERIRHDGTVTVPLQEDDVRLQVRGLRDEGVEAVAVCLLYSYVDPTHEQMVARVLAEELPDAFVSISSDVLPEFREYERLSTVVTNAFIGPVMAQYLSRLRQNLQDLGLPVTPNVTQSNGGMMSFPAAEKLPVRTVLSGPSNGVVGAAKVAEATGIDRIITFDMGGTSSDVSLVNDGIPSTARGMELDGRPIQAPMIDIHTVGAGGGSIAWIDAGGHLKVGPQSAGADPGPACYGRGNNEPTVTDANVVLGVLNQTHLLGGRMSIDANLSFAAVERLATRLGMTTQDAAQGIIRVVTANMARAIRVISVQRGYDPRDYALVTFGGAGPLHSARLAEELGMRCTLVPQRPGALSALGMLMTDVRSDYSRTAILPTTPENVDTFASTFTGLEAQAAEWFATERISADGRHLRRVVDMRYVGQNYELPVGIASGTLDETSLKSARTAFDELHAQRYGYAQYDELVEAVTFRVEASGTTSRLEFEPLKSARSTDPAKAQISSRRLYLPCDGDYREVPVYDRSLLRAGHELNGPLLIEQFDTTTLVLPGEQAVVHENGNIITTLGGGAR